MEKAIIVNNFRNIKISKLKRFDRIYYGNEFCPNLLPKISEIKKNLRFFKRINKPVSFLTSYVSNDALAGYKSTIAYLSKQKIIDEIIVNDLGILNFCQKKHPSLKLVAGRALTQIHHQGAYESLKVKRIETDRDFFYGPDILNRENKNINNKISFYYPYTIIQGTRYCSLVESDNGKINPGIAKCHKECLRIGTLKLTHSNLKKTVILIGNVQLLKMISKNEIKKFKNIDRIVYQDYGF